MQDFRQIKVWQKAHALYLDIRAMTARFPKRGYNELISQLLRAADSIPSNIVEGSTASSNREFARFVGMSIKSSTEVEYRLQVVKDCELITYLRWRSMSERTIEIRKMAIGYRKALLRDDDEP